MKEWKYTFDPVSKEEWIRQVESDLRHKPADSLNSEWWPGEPLIPLVHVEDLTGEIIRLPDSFFSNPPCIVEWVNSSSVLPAEVNRKILDALQYGAQSIIINTEQSGVIPFDAWLKDVLIDIVTIHVEFDTITTESIPKILQDAPKQLLFRLVRTNSPEPLLSIIEPLIQQSTSMLSSLRFVYKFHPGGIWTEEAAGVFSTLQDDLRHWQSLGLETSDFFKQCILWVEADAVYFKQIIQTRVLHLVWQNMKELYLKKSDSKYEMYLECHVEQLKNEIPDHFLIRASMSGLAASMSGIYGICIHHSNDIEVPGFYPRSNRNISHLLQLESSMYRGTDPLAGAYAIDFHTKKWTNRIWQLLAQAK